MKTMRGKNTFFQPNILSEPFLPINNTPTWVVRLIRRWGKWTFTYFFVSPTTFYLTNVYITRLPATDITLIVSGTGFYKRLNILQQGLDLGLAFAHHWCCLLIRILFIGFGIRSCSKCVRYSWIVEHGTLISLFKLCGWINSISVRRYIDIILYLQGRGLTITETASPETATVIIRDSLSRSNAELEIPQNLNSVNNARRVCFMRKKNVNNNQWEWAFEGFSYFKKILSHGTNKRGRQGE